MKELRGLFFVTHLFLVDAPGEGGGRLHQKEALEDRRERERDAACTHTGLNAMHDAPFVSFPPPFPPLLPSGAPTPAIPLLAGAKRGEAESPALSHQAEVSSVIAIKQTVHTTN